MKLTTRETLLRKGWDEKEIQRVENIRYEAELRTSKMSHFLFWMMIVLIGLATLSFSFSILPFLTILGKPLLYTFTAIAGLSIGSLYAFLIANSAHIDKKHHYTSALIILVISFVNLVLITFVYHEIFPHLLVKNEHHPFIIGLVFGSVILLPYLFIELVKKK